MPEMMCIWRYALLKSPAMRLSSPRFLSKVTGAVFIHTFTLSAVEVLNPTEVLPKIWSDSPVRGFLPKRAADFFCLNVPNSRRRISLPLTSTCPLHYVDENSRDEEIRKSGSADLNRNQLRFPMITM